MNGTRATNNRLNIFFFRTTEFSHYILRKYPFWKQFALAVPRVRVFGLEEAENSPYNVFCFRIPAVVQTDSGVLLAFAEARINTCADCAELGIAMRRSDDGG